MPIIEMRPIAISIVSHLQGDLVADILADIERHCASEALEVILTINLPEKLPFAVNDFQFPIKVICNTVPMGFAANHNQAFWQTAAPYFCVMNPDIRVHENPFPALLDCLQDSSVGLVAPVVVGMHGTVEDSARRFPSPLKIICKAFGGCREGDYRIGNENIFPDWVGGMFMLFRREVFERAKGFDQRYFLYYEDVDLCSRLRHLGYEIVLCPGSRVIHLAQRSSHRNLKYLRWHITSMLRFFLSPSYLRRKSSGHTK